MADVIRVLTAWTTFFRPRWPLWLLRLGYAYRAPTLFGSQMARQAGVSSGLAVPDERLLGADYDGRRDRLGDTCDLLYIAAHGRQKAGGFELLLHSDEWRPAESGLDGDGPRIVVFDACDLLDPGDPNWAASWSSEIRPNLRLVLGFASLATVSKAGGLRGEAFAELATSGMSVAQAWHLAVKGHSGHTRDRPVAIAFGSDAGEAEEILVGGDLTKIMALPLLETKPVVRKL